MDLVHLSPSFTMACNGRRTAAPGRRAAKAGDEYAPMHVRLHYLGHPMHLDV